MLIQGKIFPPFDNGNATELGGLVNVTSDGMEVQLPYSNPDGTPVYLGQPGPGYPPVLYPNLTYYGTPNDSSYRVVADGQVLDPRSFLMNGPLILGNNSALMSATRAITNNTSPSQILGWLTVIVNATMLFDVRDSGEGLGRTGEVLVVGPNTNDNKYDFDIHTASASDMDDTLVKFVLPPVDNAMARMRHKARSNYSTAATPFEAKSFPAVVAAWTADSGNVNNADAKLSSHNEQNMRVAVGWAQINTDLVNWALIVEQSYSETVEPIDRLRDIILICTFSVMGGLLVLTLPLAHYSVAPIRQLRAATRKTVEPYQPESYSDYSSAPSSQVPDDSDSAGSEAERAKKEGFFEAVTKWATKKDPAPRGTRSLNQRRQFRIPSKVPERRHLVHDELTDLTTKFNEMSDELAMQYQRLEERVKERTAELEQAKSVAEAANQSKTLFVANISHELKTPLNGILGLTSICMNETDPAKIRSTLDTIYKSGDLLLHLLTDLLTFSKNATQQQLAIDETEFRLSDLSTQLIPTFDRQAKEGQINLQVLYEGTNDSFGNSDTSLEKAFGPEGTGRVRDMCLWGDKNRILQVLMNFTSNSLKFTPPHGSVTVRIRCVGIVETETPSRHGSTRKSSNASRRSRTSKASSQKRVRTSDTSLTGGSDSDEAKRPSILRTKHTNSSSSSDAKKSILKKRPAEAKLQINVGGQMTQIDKIVTRRTSIEPPALNAKILDFEFEVEDTGPGIPEDQRGKIFEPFVQGDLGLSKKYGGTGLGLSICAQLAELMGGRLFLESTLGKGSIFKMRMPLRFVEGKRGSIASDTLDGVTLPASLTARRGSKSSSPSRPVDSPGMPYADVPRVVGLTQPFVAQDIRPAAKHSASSDLSLMKKVESEAKKEGSKVRVLVAEDNKINQEVVLRMLKLEDVYDVTIAKDGQEAYEKVRDSMQSGEKFHLVFMDVQMPNVDGIQSTKMIRGMGFSAPIVALTAFAEKSNEDECMASGMDYFLAKPIRRPALKQVLKKYCATIPEEEDSPEKISNATTNDASDRVDKPPMKKTTGATEIEVQESPAISPLCTNEPRRKSEAQKEQSSNKDDNGPS